VSDDNYFKMKKLLYILLFVPLALFGQENYSLSFDGVDDYVEINSSPLFSISNTGSFTIQFRLKMFDGGYVITHYQNLNASNSNFAIGVNDNFSSISIFGNGTNSVIFDTNINDTLYHNAVFIFNESQVSVYLDGGYIGTESINLNNSIINYPLIIGNLLGDFGNPITSNISEISLFDFAISSDDISSYFNCLIGEETGLVGYWNFNEGFGDTVYDLSGNGNHGTVYGATFSEDVPEETCSILDQLNQSFDAWNVSIDLSAGWNMFGYGCPSLIDVAEGLSNHTESILITKDNNGNVYMPEWDFNGIGDFTPGFGYQIKLSEAIEGFSLCDWYVNDIPEDNIVSLQEEVEYMSQYFGCIDDLACNYYAEAVIDDESCIYPEQGFDCNGNELTQYQVGDFAEGGIVFYVDESGGHGLIAALEDVIEGEVYNDAEEYFGFEWGCNNLLVSDADHPNIGYGYLNTIAIINSDCQSENGGEVAAQVADSYTFEEYYDWFLPSKFELIEMYNNIGLSPLTNFENHSYWSSSNPNPGSAWVVSFDSGFSGWGAGKNSICEVRPVRAFGNWTTGCMDETACNYNPEANMADGSCEYAELGYDCDGNSLIYVGAEAEGGIVFYVDETGEHGLVAALEDLTEGATDPYGWGYNGYEWGCYEGSVNGADGTYLGTGYQNTMDIVNQGCATENEGVTAAQAALDAEINSYSDWYLPSIDELSEMYNTICQSSSSGNIGGFNYFNDTAYWSSSESGNNHAKYVRFSDGNLLSDQKYSTRRVRPIRSF
jgi:hypothetical protein